MLLGIDRRACLERRIAYAALQIFGASFVRTRASSGRGMQTIVISDLYIFRSGHSRKPERRLTMFSASAPDPANTVPHTRQECSRCRSSSSARWRRCRSESISVRRYVGEGLAGLNAPAKGFLLALSMASSSSASVICTLDVDHSTEDELELSAGGRALFAAFFLGLADAVFDSALACCRPSSMTFNASFVLLEVRMFTASCMISALVESVVSS